jgi:hypothetical protein
MPRSNEEKEKRRKERNEQRDIDRRARNQAGREERAKERAEQKIESRKVSGKDREELAQARARRAGMFEEELPILKGGELTTQQDVEAEALRLNEERKQRLIGETIGEMPTDITPLVEPISSPEGLAQLEEARATEEGAMVVNPEANLLKLGTATLNQAMKGFTGISPGAEIPAHVLTGDGKNLLGNSVVDLSRMLIVAQAGGEVFSGNQLLDVIPNILGDRPEKVQNFQSALEAMNQMSTAISTDYINGNISQENAYLAIKTQEDRANKLEALIQREAILSPAVRRSGELADIQGDILELRQEIWRARATILSTFIDKEPDDFMLATRLEEIKVLLEEQKKKQGIYGPTK